MLTVMKKDKGAERSAAFLGTSLEHCPIALPCATDKVLQRLVSCRSILTHPASCNLWISLLFI